MSGTRPSPGADCGLFMGGIPRAGLTHTRVHIHTHMCTHTHRTRAGKNGPSPSRILPTTKAGGEPGESVLSESHLFESCSRLSSWKSATLPFAAALTGGWNQGAHQVRPVRKRPLRAGWHWGPGFCFAFCLQARAGPTPPPPAHRLLPADRGSCRTPFPAH